MPRCHDWIVNEKHLVNVRQTKREARKLARHEFLNHEHQWFDLFDVWISWQNHSFNCVSDFHERSFQISAYWMETPGSCKYILSSATFMALKSHLCFFFLPFWSWNYSTFKDFKQRENYIHSNRKTNLKTSYMCSAWLARMSELSRFVYIISHVTLQVKRWIEKVIN